MPETKTIKQKADEEAARAEAENPDEPETDGADGTEPANPDAEPSGEPTPEEEAEAEDGEAEQAEAKAGTGRSDKQTQAMFDRAVSAFRAKLADVFEVDDVEPSQTPGVIGFLLPGFTEHKTHSNFQRCPTCNGWGRILTGSIREGEQEADCPDPRCRGRGYWRKADVPAPPPTPVAQVTGPTVFAGQPQQRNGAEEWETPTWMGDPNLQPEAPA